MKGEGTWLSTDTPWRRCELAWMEFLRKDGYIVTRLADLEGNARGTRAPMMMGRDGLLRAPDIEAAKDGRSTLWEVKYRKRSEINEETGTPEYWMSYDSLSDYQEVSAGTGKPLTVVLLDRSAWGEDRRWRGASIQEISRAGRKERRFGAGGALIDAWVWPAECMEFIAGPQVDLSSTDDVVFPVEGVDGRDTLVEYRELAPLERALRSAGNASTEGLELHGDPKRAAELMRALGPAQHALEVLRLHLGIPDYPRYSVLRVGLDGVDLDDLLTLPRYGIRLFLVTDHVPASGVDEAEVKAFKEARLLEWTIMSELPHEPIWVVDGRGLDRNVLDLLSKAEKEGGINARQYEIVHADSSLDIIVTAGAGTGKTETMSERILYLLATSPARGPISGDTVQSLRLDDIALITFSRESAAEMRRRIARTLMTRQRLCPRSTLPTIAWLLQLGTADIDTIHTYAKKIVQRDGAVIGLTPEFRASPHTLAFRRLIREELSPALNQLFTQFPDVAPPAHEFDSFLEELWEKLAGNGLSPLTLPDTPPRDDVTWGISLNPDGATEAINRALKSAMLRVAPRFGKLCVDEQALPVDELVAAATRTVRATGGTLRKRPRYIFIDEFQDTDREQMSLLLELRRSLDARLYAVGDPKQGVYRFRGAQGNALEELRVSAHDLGPKPFTLTVNFRSDGVLLDSLHNWFSHWGHRHLLDYEDPDKLRPSVLAEGRGVPALAESSSARRRRAGDRSAKDLSAAVEIVKEWWDADEPSSIAVLCRWNRQALQVRDELRKAGVPCEVRVGGHFFRTPAVRDTAVLLEAVLHPADDAALLQLSETRWFHGLKALELLPEFKAVADVWTASPIADLMPWFARIASLDVEGSLDRRDLSPLRLRLEELSRLLDVMPTISWLLYCREHLAPDLLKLPHDVDGTEARHYGRCFDHLLSVLDSSFGAAAVSAHQVLDWVRLQAATNTAEDEPPPPMDAGGKTVIAMTVHKSKGLEFDKVLIPFCSTPFGAPPGAPTETAVVSQGGTPTLLWRWNGLDNAPGNTPDLWGLETTEIAREEARLLYVAMTRARHELRILTEGGTAGQASWDDLLA